MFKGKAVVVKISGEVAEEYKELNRIVGEEISKGITNSDHQILLNAIKQKIEFLKDNPQYGIHIQKDRIPKEYIENYEINNLWKINLPKAWRMIYTIKGEEAKIIAFILEYMDHEKYNKKFGYKKK